MVETRDERDEADDDGIDWKPIMRQLRAGNEVTIPVADPSQLAKLRRALARRAERRGMQLETAHVDDAIRARRVGDAPAAEPADGGGAEQRQAQRREKRRQERRAARGSGAAE